MEMDAPAQNMRISYTIVLICAIEASFWLHASAGSAPGSELRDALTSDQRVTSAGHVAPDSPDNSVPSYTETVLPEKVVKKGACNVHEQPSDGGKVQKQGTPRGSEGCDANEDLEADGTSQQRPKRGKDELSEDEQIARASLYGALSTHGIFCKGGILTYWGLGAVGESFLITWAAFTVLAMLTVFLTSGPLFYYYYWPSQVTFEKWQRKSNPQFPAPEKVRDEIVQMCKAVFMTTFCPATSVCLAYRGLGKAYCGAPEGYGLLYHIATFVLVIITTDFWEFYYHYLGHKYKMFWNNHKHHHVFYNPSPFAVIADEFIDQFVRAGPMLLFPLLVPINIDLMFLEFAVFFYCYGCYLHWGYELDYPDAHHPIFNTAFQHYCHHAKALIFKPYHCGFFFKIWDNLFDSVYKGDCFCVKCERAKGKRSLELFKKVEVPDYSVLLKPSFWIKKEVLGGASAQDTNSKKIRSS